MRILRVMKDMIIYILLLLFLYHPMCAQEWGVIGTRWSYDQIDVNKQKVIAEIRVVSDTIIQGDSAYVLLLEDFRSGSLVYEKIVRKVEDQKVYEWDEGWLLIYDTDVSMGDTAVVQIREQGQIKDLEYVVLTVGEYCYGIHKFDYYDIELLDKSYLWTDAITVGMGAWGSRIPRRSGQGAKYKIWRCYEQGEIESINYFLFPFGKETPCWNTTKLFTEHNDAIQIYPNPTSDIAYIDGYDGEWQCFHFSGQKVGEGRGPISLSNQPSGTYLVALIGTSQTALVVKSD